MKELDAREFARKITKDSERNFVISIVAFIILALATIGFLIQLRWWFFAVSLIATLVAYVFVLRQRNDLLLSRSVEDFINRVEDGEFD